MTALGTDIADLENGFLAEALLDIEVIAERVSGFEIRTDGEEVDHVVAVERDCAGWKDGSALEPSVAILLQGVDGFGADGVAFHSERAIVGDGGSGKTR